MRKKQTYQQEIKFKKQKQIKLLMLKKYENFYKISKTPQCSFYEANLREDMNKVLIKRIRSTWSWNQMLKSKSLKIQSASSFFPKVLQIFKHNGSYFVVYQIPYGPAMWFAESSIKLQMGEFYQICNNIINCLMDLKDQVSNMYVYPQWVFIHRNSIKIAHFQPYFQSNQPKSKKQGHVFMYDILRGSYKKEQIVEQDECKRIKNFNFNLGYITYHLITGQTTRWREDQKDYYEVIKVIQKSAKSKILYQTNDQILAQFIHSLLSFTSDPNQFGSNQDQIQAFQKFKNYVSKKLAEWKSITKNKEPFRIVEFSLQRMKLQSKTPKIAIEKKKKCYRACCMKKFQDQANPENENYGRFRVVDRHAQNASEINERMNRMKTQNFASQSSKKMKQNSESTKKFIGRHKINSSCFFPELSTERKDKKLLQRMRVHQNRSTMFRKSLHSNRMGTLKTKIPTQYD